MFCVYDSSLDRMIKIMITSRVVRAPCDAFAQACRVYVCAIRTECKCARAREFAYLRARWEYGVEALSHAGFFVRKIFICNIRENVRRTRALLDVTGLSG